MTLTVGDEWELDPERTIKDITNARRPYGLNNPTLNARYAIQVSACTGVGQRVPLRVMLADKMAEFAINSIPSPVGWPQLEKDGLLIALRSDAFETWMKQRSITEQNNIHDLMASTLCALNDTGIDSTGVMAIACVENGDPYRCIKLGPRGNHWMRVLSDSHYSATYAYMTRTCLQTPQTPGCWCDKLRKKNLASVDSAITTSPTTYQLIVRKIYLFEGSGTKMLARAIDSTRVRVGYSPLLVKSLESRLRNAMVTIEERLQRVRQEWEVTLIVRQ